MIVVDASAPLALLLRGGGWEVLEARLFAPAQSLHAPHLVDVEVAQVLRRYSARGMLESARCEMALDDFAHLRLRRYSHAPLMSRVWTLRHNLTAYDAVYVALAEALDAPLVTCDARLAGAPGHGARVERV